MMKGQVEHWYPDEDHPLSFEIAIRRRIEFARTLFLQLGFEGQELETRTLAFVGYMRMVHSANDPRVRREHLRHLDKRHAILTGS